MSNRLSGVVWGGAEEEERCPSRDGSAAMDGGNGSSKAEEGGDIEVQEGSPRDIIRPSQGRRGGQGVRPPQVPARPDVVWP